MYMYTYIYNKCIRLQRLNKTLSIFIIHLSLHRTKHDKAMPKLKLFIYYIPISIPNEKQIHSLEIKYVHGTVA